MATPTTRRGFLEGSLAALALASSGAAREPEGLPSGSGDPEDDAWWDRLRSEQFAIPQWRAYLNNGSLGVCPKPVIRAVVDSVWDAGRRETYGDYPRWGYEPMEELRDKLAAFVGTTRDRLALTHNATHAMFLVAGGYPFERGDQIIHTDQEHPTLRGTWKAVKDRYGIEVTEVPVPLAPQNPSDIADVLIGAITPRTKMLVFSDILTTTGSRVPVHEICARARAKGVLTVVDGAHCPGQVPLDIDRIGCDAYCASPHKWLLSPAGTGFLVLTEELMDTLWCANGSHWWDRKDLKAVRFMGLGTNNVSVMDGLDAALDWYAKIGAERIYARQHALARYVLDKSKQLPGADLATADDDSQFFGMVSVGVKGMDYAKTEKALRERGLWTTRANERYRISCHVHVRRRDLDSFFEVLDDQIGAQGLG